MSAVLEPPRRTRQVRHGALVAQEPPRTPAPLRVAPGTLPPLPALLRRAALLVQAPYVPADAPEVRLVADAPVVPRLARYQALLGGIQAELRQSRRLTRERVERLVLRYYVAGVEVRALLAACESTAPVASITVPLPPEA